MNQAPVKSKIDGNQLTPREEAKYAALSGEFTFKSKGSLKFQIQIHNQVSNMIYIITSVEYEFLTNHSKLKQMCMLTHH